MAEIYTVHFTVLGESTNALFEFDDHAILFARYLDESPNIENVGVTDMQRNEVWPDG